MSNNQQYDIDDFENTVNNAKEKHNNTIATADEYDAAKNTV